MVVVAPRCTSPLTLLMSAAEPVSYRVLTSVLLLGTAVMNVHWCEEHTSSLPFERSVLCISRHSSSAVSMVAVVGGETNGVESDPPLKICPVLAVRMYSRMKAIYVWDRS